MRISRELEETGIRYDPGLFPEGRSSMICKNCGEEIGWYGDKRTHPLVHTKTRRDLCHRATFAEPAEIAAFAELELKLLLAQEKIKELEQRCRDFGANQTIAAADAVR